MTYVIFLKEHPLQSELPGLGMSRRRALPRCFNRVLRNEELESPGR